MATLDITALSYDSVSLSFGATAANTKSVFFKPDGSAIYTIDYADKKVYCHTLSTDWDLTTATLAVSSYSISSQISYPNGLCFSTDGTKMYASSGLIIFQYTLSSAWDITSATYDSKSADLSAQSLTSIEFRFNPYGDVVFVVGDGNNNNIFEYVLSTPWDISTAAYSTYLYTGGDFPASANCIAVTSDGKQIVLGNSGGLSGFDAYCYQYTMTGAWDLSTATYTGDFFFLDGEDDKPFSLFFKDSDTKLYYYGGYHNVLYQYSTNLTEHAELGTELPQIESIMGSGAYLSPQLAVPQSVIWARIYSLNHTQPARIMEATAAYCFAEATLPSRTVEMATTEALNLAFELPAFTSAFSSNVTMPATMVVTLPAISSRMYAACRISATIPKRSAEFVSSQSVPATMGLALPDITMVSHAAGGIGASLKAFMAAMAATSTHLTSMAATRPTFEIDFGATTKSLHPLSATIPAFKMSGTASKVNQATMAASWERFSFYADGYYGGVASMSATMPKIGARISADFSTGNSFATTLPIFECDLAADNYTDVVLRHVRGAIR